MNADTHLGDSNLLAAYIEDRLDEHERRSVTQHLLSCSACRAALAAMARDRDERAQAAPGIVERPGRGGRGRITWLSVAAGLVIATVAGVRFLMAPEPPVSAPSVQQPDTAQRPISPPPRGQDLPGGSTPQPARRPTDPATIDPGLLARRAAERRIGSKTFRLISGEWTDTAYDPIADLPEVRTSTREETTLLVQRLPTLVPYTALGARVVVVLDGTVYRLHGAPAPTR